MITHTVLLDFTVPPSEVVNLVKRDKLKSNIVNTLEKHFGSVGILTDVTVENGFVSLYSGPKHSMITVRGNLDGMITVNVDYDKNIDEEAMFSLRMAEKLEIALQKAISAIQANSLVPIKRCEPFQRYLYFPDFRMVESDADKVLFDTYSPYQKVQVVHTKTFGNVLILDKIQNLSEADLVYTETLMLRGKENYAGKDVLILGGGDGALLYEILKEKPNHVTMLELDEVVMEACSQHMRSCCGNVLDKRKTDKYEIIVGDCFLTLNKMIEEKRKFDYVFGDLTDFPINTTSRDDAWNFIKLILNSAMKILKPTGKYITHGNGSCCKESLQTFEDVLKSLQTPVKFTTANAWVPSFFDNWIFYQVSFK